VDRSSAANPYDKAFADSEVYRPVVSYLHSRGWRREELGSGWWWREGFEEATLGGALEQQLDADGINQRDAIPYEPEEFWG
jgi:hypothetical protein